MTDHTTPPDGDYAAYLSQRALTSSTEVLRGPTEAPPPQTLHDVLVYGEKPTEAFLDEFNALNDAPPLSDEELEQQALQDGGADGDVRTGE